MQPTNCRMEWHRVWRVLAILALSLPVIAFAGDVTPKVVGGINHSLALKPEGTVWAWGSNRYGQLGDGSMRDRVRAQRIWNLAGIKDISAGYGHSLAVAKTGTVFAWGWNCCGQIGDGSATTRPRPTAIANLSGVIAVAAGGNHSLALKSDGTVWSWGDNTKGQLGDGTTTQRSRPVAVQGLTGVVAIVAGAQHSLALKSDGTVVAWGYNGSGQLGDGSTTDRYAPVIVPGLANVTQLAAGACHSLALDGNSSVLAWGDNSFGQLGDGTTVGRSSPSPVPGLGSWIVAISAGSYYSQVRIGYVNVLAWGDNSSGQLGDGTTIQRLSPVHQAILDPGVSNDGYGYGDVIWSLGAGGSHSVAMRPDGAVLAWGYNGHGQLGDGSRTSRTAPVKTAGLWKYVAVSAGQVHSLALREDGRIMAWGDNGGGQLGDGTTNARRASPGVVPGVGRAVAVAAGSYFSLALDADGQVWGWGNNAHGELGDGIGSGHASPVRVAGLADVVAIAAGAYYGLALKSDGTVWAWGWNVWGQLGDGTTTNRSTPVQVRDLSDAVAISAGLAHSLALRADGTVVAWGNNDNGRLGNGTTTNSLTPVSVSGLTGIVAVAGGSMHSLALKSDGTVWTWGHNGSGRLGDNTNQDRWTPVQALGLAGAIAISAGEAHSLAVASNGTVWGWGQNRSGVLDLPGSPMPVDQWQPVALPGTQTGFAVGVATGFAHSLAIDPEGQVKGWGDNRSGQVGDGTVASVKAPVLADDNFPPGAALPAGWTTPSGAAPWSAVNDVTNGVYAGRRQLKSSIVADNGVSAISYTGHFREGFVRFALKVSSKAGENGLVAGIDGHFWGHWSGDVPWRTTGIYVSAGKHTITWQFMNYSDGSADAADAAWIDDVSLPLAAPNLAPILMMLFD